MAQRYPFARVVRVTSTSLSKTKPSDSSQPRFKSSRRKRSAGTIHGRFDVTFFRVEDGLTLHTNLSELRIWVGQQKDRVPRLDLVLHNYQEHNDCSNPYLSSLLHGTISECQYFCSYHLQCLKLMQHTIHHQIN